MLDVPDATAWPLALHDTLNNIATLARETGKPKVKPPARRLLDAQGAPAWSLALDEICSCGVELAPRLPYAGPRDFTGPMRAPRAIARAAPPPPDILKPVKLDPLTVADDPGFLNLMSQQPNVPAPIKNGLSALY